MAAVDLDWHDYFCGTSIALKEQHTLRTYKWDDDDVVADVDRKFIGRFTSIESAKLACEQYIKGKP